MVKAVASLFCVLVAASVLPAQVSDRAKVNEETLLHYTNLLRLDTSNPPGNETRAVEYLKSVLEREGIPFEVLASDPARANIVARLRGNGSKKPVIVMGHTDVVGVQREKWSVDPFGAVRKDGFIWGRGATDDKDNVVASLMTILLLRRNRVPLDRDVIFIAESGEEGSTGVGIDFLIREHWPKIEAEYCLAEGGSIAADSGSVKFVEITNTEKVSRGARLVAHGSAGHGSRPRADNAIVRLANAISRLAAWEAPSRLSDTTRLYFERLAGLSAPEDAARYRAVLDPQRRADVIRYFAMNEPGHASILRTSISPTILQAGFRSNVIPSEATATLDIRALPDEDMNWFYSEMRRIIGDANVEVIAGTRAASPPGAAARTPRPASPPSPLDSELFKALETVTQRMFPGAPVIPSMLTGATDMAQLRARGVKCYGIGPAVDLKDAGAGGAHADDERLREESIYRFVEFSYNTVVEIAGARN